MESKNSTWELTTLRGRVGLFSTYVCFIFLEEGIIAFFEIVDITISPFFA